MTRRLSFDVVVVGGGVIGCATAYALAGEGHRVGLLERDHLAAHASGAAAGMLAPLSEASGPGPFLSLGLEALAEFPALCARLVELSGVDPEFEASGVLRVATGESEADELESRASRLPGCGLQWLDAGAARALAPGLSSDVVGALWSPQEAHVRSPLLAEAYARAAEALGARILAGSLVLGIATGRGRVEGVETSQGRVAAPAVVVCTGAWAAELYGWLPAERGFAPPVAPVRGQIVSIESPHPAPRAIVWSGSTYLVPKRDGSLVVGATEERVGFDCRLTAEGVEGLLASARRVLPTTASARFRGGFAGLRPASPDGLPLIGPVPGTEGLWLAAGHHRNGVLLSAVTAARVADGVLGKDSDGGPFAPARFAGDGL
ncbi:MAG: glycine oxidase ThiO [Proteobacteria bacterium]|nr:glycine oxidase ThiO [Pseudomonadota bacterium]